MTTDEDEPKEEQATSFGRNVSKCAISKCCKANTGSGPPRARLWCDAARRRWGGPEAEDAMTVGRNSSLDAANRRYTRSANVARSVESVSGVRTMRFRDARQTGGATRAGWRGARQLARRLCSAATQAARRRDREGRTQRRATASGSVRDSSQDAQGGGVDGE